MTTARNRSKEEQIRSYYQSLFQAWGCQHWWPARTRFEVIVGAYLTQNTAWANVERALRSLRASGLLTLDGIRRVPLPQLEALIRSAGYFRQKARRLKTFVAYLDEYYGGSLNCMFEQSTEKLRQELLALNGIGPETADSILLYAGNHPVFVADAYTRRILDRHGILPEKAPYETIRDLFERALAPLAADFVAQPGYMRGERLRDIPAGTCHSPSPMSTAKRSGLVQIYNEMHGLIVGVGKNYCVKSKPRCEACPLKSFLP
jgi:endonuclease III related protein